MTFQTDFSPLERTRHAHLLKQIAGHANKAADALLAEDDENFLAPFTLLMLSQILIKPIADDVASSIELNEISEFADFINT